MNTQDNTQLVFAARHGDAAEVQRLISLCNPMDNNSAALCEAAFNGHSKCLKMLLPVSDAKANNSQALKWAAYNGFSRCVNLLIPVSDPKANDSQALRAAVLYSGFTECVDLLIKVSDANLVLHLIKTEFPNDHKRWEYLEQKISEQQRERLRVKTYNSAEQKIAKIRKI